MATCLVFNATALSVILCRISVHQKSHYKRLAGFSQSRSLELLSLRVCDLVVKITDLHTHLAIFVQVKSVYICDFRSEVFLYAHSPVPLGDKKTVKQ